MQVNAEAKMGWDKEQRHWDKHQARWDKQEAKWAAREAKWRAREAHYQAQSAHWGEQQAHWDKSREEWEQIGRMTLTALALAARAGIAGLNRIQFDHASEQPQTDEPSRADERSHANKSHRAERRHTESFPPAAVGALMVLIGLIWLMASSGARLFSGMFFFLVLIGVLAAVFTIVTRRDEAKQPSDAWSTQPPTASVAEETAQQAAAQVPVATPTAAQTAQPPAQTPPRSAAPQRAPATPAVPFTAKVMSALQGNPAEPKRDPSYYRQRAKDYRLRIQRILKSRRRGPLTDAMAAAAQNVQRWEERVGQLTVRLATFEKDAIIQRDLREVPRDITRLRKLSETETDPEIHKQMVRTLSGYEAQQGLLDTLVRLMRRTRLQLDDTLAAMGTIYSQVQVLDAMDISGPKAARIAEEIDEQVVRLNDLLSALGDAYGGSVSDGVAGVAEASEAPEQAARRSQSSQDHAAG
jgi:hypothetical protein